MEAGMKGLTKYNFNCATNSTYTYTGEAPTYVFRFKTLDIRLSLPIMTFLPSDASAVLKAHENGHLKSSAIITTPMQSKPRQWQHREQLP